MYIYICIYIYIHIYTYCNPFCPVELKKKIKNIDNLLIAYQYRLQSMYLHLFQNQLIKTVVKNLA